MRRIIEFALVKGATKSKSTFRINIIIVEQEMDRSMIASRAL